MFRRISIASAVALLFQTAAVSQTRNDAATVIARDEIQTVANAGGAGDREIRILDMGKYNLGVAVLRRTATRPGAPITAINHTQLTEVYYVVSGSATLVTGGEVEGVRPLPAENELVTTVVGPGNTAVFKRPDSGGEPLKVMIAGGGPLEPELFANHQEEKTEPPARYTGYD